MSYADNDSGNNKNKYRKWFVTLKINWKTRLFGIYCFVRTPSTPATRLPLQMWLFIIHIFYVLYAKQMDANVVIGKTNNTKQIYKFIFNTKFLIITTMTWIFFTLMVVLSNLRHTVDKRWSTMESRTIIGKRVRGPVTITRLMINTVQN